MRVFTLSAIIILIAALPAFSQNAISDEIKLRKMHFDNAEPTTILDPVELSPERESTILQEVEAAQFYKLEENEIDKILKNKPEVLKIALSLEGKGSIQLQLYKKRIFSGKPIITTASEDGQNTGITSGSVHYWGIVGDQEGSLASMSFSTTGIMGMFSFDGDTWELGALEQDEETYILFNVDDLRTGLPFECGVTDQHKVKSRQDVAESAVYNPDNCVKVYVEIDHNIFLDKGGVMPATNFVEGIFNEVFILYANESIESSIWEIFVWDVPSPYGTGTVLGEFRTYRNNNGGFDGDIAHLVSFNGGGGVAYLDVLCSPSFAYAYSGIGRSYQNVPNYSWSVDVVAHEMGHNVGSPHTHDCSWNGNNTPIDCCGPEAGHDGGGCGSGFNCDIPLPSNGGTVMSYCHLNVGKDLGEGFHPQVGSLFQDEVYNAPCLNICPSEPLVALFDHTPPEVCEGSSVQFTDQSTGAVVSWNWGFPGGTPSSSTSQDPVIFYDQPGVFNVTLTVIDVLDDTSTLTIEDAITVIALPEANFDHELLSTRQVQFENLSTAATEYAWDFGDFYTSTEENPLHYYEYDGIYTVRLEATNQCGSDSYEEDITAAIPPILEFTASSEEGCPSLEVTFDASLTYNANSYEWYFEGGDPSTSQEIIQDVQFDSAGRFDVMLVGTNDFFSDTLFFANYIKINPLPISDFTFSIKGDTVEFENGSMHADSLVYDFGDGNISTDANPLHIYGHDSIYTVRLISFNECGVDTIEQEVQLLSIPTAGISGLDSLVCLGDTVEFSASSFQSTNSYYWEFEGATPDTSRSPNPKVVYDSSGIFDVHMIVTNSLGSDTAMLQNAIEVLPDPAGNFEYDLNGREVELQATASNFERLEWDLGDGRTGDSLRWTHVYEKDSLYEVVLRIFSHCDTLEVRKDILVEIPPVAAYSSSSLEGCRPLEIQFESNSSSNTESVKWILEGATPDTSYLHDPGVVYEEAGEFDVILIAYSENRSDTLIDENAVKISQEPVADFDLSLDSNTVRLTNRSLFADSLIWYFGDGQSSHSNEIIYTYGSSGDYEVSLVVINECGVDTLQQMISIIVNNASFSNENKIRIFPNPGSDYLRIQGIPLGTKVVIFNSLGHLTHREIADSENLKIKSYQWAEGMYFIQLEKAPEVRTFKWILQR